MGRIEGGLRADLRLGPEANLIITGTGSGATMQQGIDAATAGNGDVILHLPGGEEVSTPVLFNKSHLRVMAVGPTLNPVVSGEFHGIFAASSLTDEPAAIISAACTIEGIGFVSRDTGSTFFSGAALLIGGTADANPFGVQLKGCRFPKWALDNRIGLAIEGSSDCLIEECIFEGVGAAFDSGIYVQGAIANLIVRRNYFRQCTYAITHGAFSGTELHAFYHENLLIDSKMLDSGGFSTSGLIAGNWMETATNATSYDATVATLKGQGLNFAGNHYSE